MFRYLLVLAAFLLFVPPARAQEENVYLIKMFECTHQPVQRSQTGFRVKGLKGIVTALHGVVDCQRITASSREGLLLDQPLTIRKVDSDHDVALISSPQLDSAENMGLDVARSIVWESLGAVKVYGHPYGISSLERTLQVSRPALKPLKDLIPAVVLTILKERRSPNHLINVLNLQGNLLPGHSGAPIVDSSGRVVAVANGGLKEGMAGISWAVPFRDIEWDNADSELKTLAQLNPNVLFDYDALSTQQPDAPGDETCRQLSRFISEAQTGFISIVGEPIGTLSGGFLPKIQLPGALESYVYPPRYVFFLLFGPDSEGKAESKYYNWVSKVSSCLPNWKRVEIPGNAYQPRISSFREHDRSPEIEITCNHELTPPGTNSLFTVHLRIKGSDH